MLTPAASTTSPTWLARAWDSDFFYQYRHSPVAIGASLVALICLVGALFAGWIAPHNPFDLATVDLSDARLPPAEGAADGGVRSLNAKHACARTSARSRSATPVAHTPDECSSRSTATPLCRTVLRSATRSAADSIPTESRNRLFGTSSGEPAADALE